MWWLVTVRTVSQCRTHRSSTGALPKGSATPWRSRQELAYHEDRANLVTLAMNGWADAEPAWWLNLQARPDATVAFKDGSRTVRARATEGEEPERCCAANAAAADG